ncbi:MAG: hypothetical protein LUG95_01545 [Clostridiales bacterium]|nr:hypothetical protein [Clostridiales bacterium]
MQNTNDIPQIEGIKEFFTNQIYEYVFPYLRKQGCFNDDNNDKKMLKQVRSFLDRTDKLTKLPAEKLQESIDLLHKELLELLKIASEQNK